MRASPTPFYLTQPYLRCSQDIDGTSMGRRQRGAESRAQTRLLLLALRAQTRASREVRAMLPLGPLVAKQPLPHGRCAFVACPNGQAGLTVEGVVGSEIGVVVMLM